MPKNKIIFVSFYTPDYGIMAGRLKASLQVLCLSHDLVPVEDKPSFAQIVRYKPRFLCEMVEKHPDFDAVIWVDSDALVQADPKLLFKIEEDFAVHYRDGVELLSGTMFWRTNYRARQALKAWAGMCDDPKVHAPRQCSLDCPEQQILQQMLPQLNISLYHLPSEYCKIHGLVELNDRARDVNPVIEHFQASRETRMRKP